MPGTQVPEPGSDSVSLVALLPHASRNADGTGAAVEIAASYGWLAFELVCTEIPLDAGASLDVWIDQSLDGGYNWDELVRFTNQPGGTVVPLAQVATLPVRERDAAGEVHMLNNTLTSGTVRSTVLGRVFRVRWEVTGADPFSFQVLAIPRGTR